MAPSSAPMRPRSGVALRVGMRVLAAAIAFGAARLLAACSLGNVSQEDCADDAECVSAFGLGSACEGGYCAAAPVCTTNVDCRDALGAATVCAAKKCTRASLDERCKISEPETLLATLQAGESVGDTLLMGAVLLDDGGNQSARIAAIRLAVREMNKAGGVLGRPFGLVVCHNQGSEADATIAADLVVHLGDEIGAPVVVGPASTNDAIAAVNAVLASPAPIAIISPSATGGQLTLQSDRFRPDDPVGMFWRTAPSDELQAKVLAKAIDAALGAEEEIVLSVLYQDDAYGQGLEAKLRSALEEVPGDFVLRSEKFALTDLEASVGEAIARAKDEQPAAVIVLAGNADRALAVVRAASDRAELRTLPFFFSDGAKDKSVLLQSGDDGVDAILAGATGTSPANPVEGSFFDALESDFGVEASQFGFVAHAYDAAYIAALGLAHAARDGGHLDGLQVAIGLSHLSAGSKVALGPSDFSGGVTTLLTADGTVNVTGQSGPLDFDAATGDAPGPIEIWRVAAGGEAFERVGDPETPSGDD